MKRLRVKLALAVVAAGALAIGIATVAVAGGGKSIRERLTGYQEVPALSTPGVGKFRASTARGQRDPLPADLRRPRIGRDTVPHPFREQDKLRADRRVPVHESWQWASRDAGLSDGRRNDQRDDQASGRRRRGRSGALRR